MAALNDLINQIEDEELKRRINQELDKLTKQKKFGLVFEDHLPECTPLYDVPVKKGAKVALKNGKINDNYTVLSVLNDKVICIKKNGKETVEFNKNDLVTVAEFGEPIYPCLKLIDSVCNAPDSDLWHTLIQADNYHALQLLEYLYPEKVDCIYIDPPYNTGAKDWKYNNDYVDSNDAYRHSKWLSMMQKRLKLAKKLLNPTDSVLIVTIDEKEYLHLGCLLEEMFPETRIQMISSVINPASSARNNQFGRTDEYIFIVALGEAGPIALPLDSEWYTGDTTKSEKQKAHWDALRRSGTDVFRTDRPNMFFPIYVNKETKVIEEIGNYIALDVDRSTVVDKDGCVTVWPIRKDGTEGRWRVGPETLRKNLSKGYVKAGSLGAIGGAAITYLNKTEIERIENGVYPVLGYENDGSIKLGESDEIVNRICGTQWRIKSHNATTYGTNLLGNIIGLQRFSFPKSLYAVHDVIKFYEANKPNSLIIDFFAGSGTTLHAVNLLNAEDGGKRRCIMVTNNEVSDEEAKSLKAKGINPGDDEWENLGIAKYVTWPRTVCSILGKDIKGNPIKGNYIGTDEPMSNGFKSNAAFFKLSFLDKTAVALGRQFRELLSTLWLKAGIYGKCPELVSEEIPNMMILPENKFAILTDENYFSEFEIEVKKYSEIQTAFIITDYEKGFKTMTAKLRLKNTYQLYRDYLDNFRINTERN